jgi:AraC-like DNA-binding protein
MEMTLSYGYLDANLIILDMLGFPKSQALEMLGLDESSLRWSLDRLDIDSFIDVINAAADFTAEPNIALYLGHKFRVGTFGQTGNLYGSCKDLREVILMNDRYQKVAIDAGRVEYMQDPSGGHHMCFRPYYADTERHRPITDIIMASYVTTYRWLTWGSGENILSTRLPYPRPKNIKVHQEIFQSNIQFDSPHTCLEFSESAMFQDIITHDPERLARAQIKLDGILAQRMGLSWSALRTQLAESGEGIRPRLDRIRRSVFIEKYEAGQNLTQIAMSLAYNDQAAMNRAFRRWFDMTPSEWRRQREKQGL